MIKALPFLINHKIDMKKYEYLHGESASFTLKVGDKVKQIVFQGGRTVPFKTKPFYKTADKQEQKAIEALSVFGHLVTLAPGYGQTESSAAENAGAPAPQGNPADQGGEGDGQNDPQGGEGENGPQGDSVYPDVTKVQEAREVLIAEYEVKASDLPNKAVILQKAAELKVSFPNLPE